MSRKLNDVKDDPETFITDLDELRERTREDPFNEEISDNSFLIHITNSLYIEYKSEVEPLEKNLWAGILTVESLKQQVRSKYNCLMKK